MSSHSSPADTPSARKPVTLHTLREMHARGEKIAMITAYDASFAALVDTAGVDCILVGDSLGMVLKGQSSTLSVTMEQIGYHTRSTSRGTKAAFLIADMPFGSYQENPVQALRNAGTLMAAGAQMVKLEGGGWTPETVNFLVERGVPVCAHLGLTPQSVHALGGYRIQGKDEAGAATLRRHAKALADAGAAMMVLELMPSRVAREVQADNPGLMTIGIGAGAGTAGQVLVLHDMLGVTRGRLPRFVRNFMDSATSIEDAVRRYVAAVKDGSFPDETLHAY
ncbi:3-methyl-2-oxobutanoate hydroxymethyltransferase [Methylibium petroleiphilum]|uniref:3-methyl-2-oxobutanoate hydroxymethyltransferase 2 n=1 Tax=Methylibium petroleiphilum (strain ATCC BAA-1232 / LMG 22953 / PM1) TaxID=420662 RepID=PANB2_METPP|nr:3-methyl-2-oxobutanoate hydroxymethyltransferase [Methylibium petroleiphilum]A2SEX8.2 RecName: Full=3-methyl-2-oxobutanoate hydroxymethyltransferase 2; AltName: Full=Ketopantoate hydroxymethyltransferase 2; Short=KPHMT 2 [Methylibium petroleiphilum PM1]